MNQDTKLFGIMVLLAISLMVLFSVVQCSAEEDTSPPPSIVTTPKPEPEPPAPTQYTLTVTAGEGGTVSSNGGTYDEGTQVTITATPNEGYEFVGWEGSDSESNSLSVTLNGNTIVQAVFQSKISLIRSTIIGESNEVKTGFSMMGIFQFNDNNIFFLPSDFFTLPTYPLLHLKRDTIWQLEKVYSEFNEMQVWRDVKKIDEYNFVVADQGLEFGQEDRNQIVDLSLLEMGETYIFNFTNNQLSRKILSPNRGFYHSIDVGDLNNDKNLEIVSMYMALPSEYNEPLNGTNMYMFSEQTENSNNFINTTNKINPIDYYSKSSGAIIIDDFNGDNQPDLIKFSYKKPVGYNLDENHEYSYVLFSNNPSSNKIEVKLRKERFEEFPNDYGIAWARSSDIDKDGDLDLIVFMEEGNGGFKLDSWKNDSFGDFSFHQRIISTENFEPPGKKLNSRDFEIYDFDNDGDLDIFLQPQGQIPYPINFSKYIYLNNDGIFEKNSEDLIWDQNPNSEFEIVPIFFLKFIKIGGKPGFFGIKSFDETTGSEVEDGRLEIYEFLISN